MRNIVCLLAAVSLYGSSCSKNGGTPGDLVPQKYYLTKIANTSAPGSNPIVTVAGAYNDEWKPISLYAYSATTVNGLLTSLIAPPSPTGTAYTFVYNNNVPALGLRVFTSTGYTFTDSLRYSTDNNRVSRLAVYKRVDTRVQPPIVSNDTLERYIVSYYSDGSPSRVYVQYSNFSSVEMEFTYGTHKSPFYENRLNYLLLPEFTLASMLTHAVTLFTAHEVTAIKRTTVNGSITVVDNVSYTYQYNAEGYPVSAKISGDVYSGYTQVFEYLVR